MFVENTLESRGIKMKSTQTTKTQNPKNEKQLERCAVLFQHTSKNGVSYLSGKEEGDGMKLIGFYNTQKKNPKQPDIEIYESLEDGQRSKESLIALWTKEKCATGYDNEKHKLVAFFNTSKDGKHRILNVYYQKGE